MSHGIHTELVTHTCGHERAYSRPSAEDLKVVVEYAKTTLCWDCWSWLGRGANDDGRWTPEEL
jgi:hypothetical protein